MLGRQKEEKGNCSGHQEPEYSRGRLCKALGSWGSGNLEGRGGYIGKGWVYKEGVGQDGSVISNLGPEVDIPVTAGGSQVSGRVYKGSERGIEKGARGISKGKKRARGLRHVYCNLFMCTLQ